MTDGKDWILDGRLDFVPYGLDASAVLVPALAADGSCNLFLVARDAAGLGFERQRGTNHEPLDTLTFDARCGLAADAMLGEAGAGEGIREWIAERAATALGFIQLGVLAEALRRTAAHTVERKQFGKQLAAFQAVAHRAADAYIDIEALRSTLWQAAWRIEQGLPAAFRRRRCLVVGVRGRAPGRSCLPASARRDRCGSRLSDPPLLPVGTAERTFSRWQQPDSCRLRSRTFQPANRDRTMSTLQPTRKFSEVSVGDELPPLSIDITTRLIVSAAIASR